MLSKLFIVLISVKCISQTFIPDEPISHNPSYLHELFSLQIIPDYQPSLCLLLKKEICNLRNYCLHQALRNISSHQTYRLQISLDLLSEEEEDMFHKMKLVLTALRDGDTIGAEETIRIALDVAEEGGIGSASHCFHDLLTTLAVTSRKWNEAEDSLSSIARMFYNDGLRPFDHSFISVVMNLALVRASRGDSDRTAEMGFRFCIKELRRKPYNEAEDEAAKQLLSTALFLYGRFLTLRGRLSEGRYNMEQALEVAHNRKKIHPFQKMVLLYWLSEVMIKDGNYDWAIQILFTALRLNPSKDNHDLPSYYIQIGRVHLLQRNPYLAYSWSEKAISFAKSHRKNEIQANGLTCLHEIHFVKCMENVLNDYN